jgi:hypothetical protein
MLFFSRKLLKLDLYLITGSKGFFKTEHSYIKCLFFKVPYGIFLLGIMAKCEDFLQENRAIHMNGFSRTID